MATIIRSIRLGAMPGAPARVPVAITSARPKPEAANPPPPPRVQAAPRLSVEAIDSPAYMVNGNFELEWYNARADEDILRLPKQGPSSDITDRSLFPLLLGNPELRRAESWDELVRFHLAIAKRRLSKAALLAADTGVDVATTDLISSTYDRIEAVGRVSLLDTEVNLAPRGETPRRFKLYASFFREGIFFAYEPIADERATMMDLLSRRDLVIRDLLKNRRPYHTPVAVLVADLQDSTKICAELPAEEYFGLINELWGAMEPKLRKYYATHGKHVGDGILYYFFPQPDCDYVLNALQCALEMKETMREISRKWETQKLWANKLHLNTGVDEGQEWFGTYETATYLEFTVLGDTINRAARLSDLARGGAVWATKNTLSRLPGRERARVRYGVRRRTDDDKQVVVPSSFSRVSNLLDLDNPKNFKFKDIATLPVTEILSIGD